MITFGSSNSIMTSTFNPANPTIFIIHGFFDTGDEGWLRRMSESILKLQPSNVIRVDWHEASRTIKYGQAATDIQVVAASIACLLDNLMEQKPFKVSDLTCVGHSLGAQTCGYVGQNILKRFGEKLPIIHGLDPAEPYFKVRIPSFIWICSRYPFLNNNFQEIY
jgi:pimeloyl-ACP methyl ester carboxylesterase